MKALLWLAVIAAIFAGVGAIWADGYWRGDAVGYARARAENKAATDAKNAELRALERRLSEIEQRRRERVDADIAAARLDVPIDECVLLTDAQRNKLSKIQ